MSTPYNDVELEVAQFLEKHGYSQNAAAGIAGDIAGESGGNPAEPGGGLIQILQGGPGYTTDTSLAAQEQAILTYNNAQGASALAQLNAATSPQQAADLYSELFERPLNALSDVRSSVADAVGAALSGTTPTGTLGTGSTGTGSTGSTGTGSIGTTAQAVIVGQPQPGSLGYTPDASSVVTTLSDTTPSWLQDLALIPGIGPFTTLLADLWNMVNYPTRQLAFMIDRAFGMFKPGQGWRLVFATAGIAAVWFAMQKFRDGSDEGFTLALTLTGVAAVALFIGLRPWPTVNSQPIKPGGYVYDIFKGDIPPAGPPATSEVEVDVIQATLDLILMVWVIQKIAGIVYDVAEAANATKNTIFGFWGNLF